MARASDKTAATPAAGRGAQPDGGDGLGIDAILDRLEQVVADLEGGDLPLEQALDRFEQGIHLARRGNTLLDRVEQRVEMLLADRDEVVALPDASAEGDEFAESPSDPRSDSKRTR